MMVLNAKSRLLAAPWALTAMPQIVPDEYESSWFEDFYKLRQEDFLFPYGDHKVFGYSQPGSTAVFFVALNPSGIPVYINEVYQVTLDYSDLDPSVQRQLHGYKFWLQSSVAFSKDADRSNLKGLATKIFWDYLASNRNAAITDIQQSPAGATFWKKILTEADYLPIVVDSNYRTDYMKAVSSENRFTDRSHLQYDVKLLWKESREGSLMRIIVTRDIK